MENKIVIEECMGEIKKRFEKYPDIFLTEEDVRGHIFSRLLKNFGNGEETKNGSISISAHSDISWYDGDGFLALRPDIAIIEVGTLDMTEETSKGFYVDKIPFGIEIKLNRGDKSKETVLSELLGDLDKLKELGQRNKETSFYMIYLDKGSRLEKNEIEELQLKYPAKIIYATI